LSSIPGSEEHGSLDYAELQKMGINPADVMDFSVNSNPFGPSPKIQSVVQGLDVSRYPDRRCTELRLRLAELNGVSPQEILIGNGTAELIWLAAHALLKAGDGVLISGPTFGEYRRAAQALQADVAEIRAEAPLFRLPVDGITAHIRKARPRMVFICNPNNPTGIPASALELEEIIFACPEDCVLVLDQAYQAFLAGEFFGALPVQNVIALRSMTKDFALAGLRLGYALAGPRLIEMMQEFQPAWSVNAAAQTAGLAALSDLAWYQQTLEQLRVLRAAFFAQIAGAIQQHIISATHFGLLCTFAPAREVRLRLLRDRIQVRDCASFGLPGHIRISTRLEPDNLRLLEQLHALRRENYL
jgi:histidinol-phosphate aminotransferase